MNRLKCYGNKKKKATQKMCSVVPKIVEMIMTLLEIKKIYIFKNVFYLHIVLVKKTIECIGRNDIVII